MIMVILMLQPTSAFAAEWLENDRFNISPASPSLAPVEVARIRSNLLPGVIVGGHYEGMLNILQHHYTASGNLEERLEDSLRRVVEDELIKGGYAVTASVSPSIFEDQLVSASEPGRFLIGGSITNTALNSYSSWLGNHTKEQRTVRWEVLDRDRHAVIYQRETSGEAEVEGIDNPAATYEAIRASVKALLTQPDFASTLDHASKAVSNPKTVSYAIEAIAAPTPALTIERVAGHTIPSVVGVRTPDGRGSGFLIDPSGLIVTNQHVVESNALVNVDLYDGSTQPARVLKRDATFDVALLKMEGDFDVQALPVCSTNAIRVGEGVVAIGNPLSYSNTVTQGIVSSIRSVGSRTLIQTDAAINPGNSGGPLLNRDGTVVGIVTEKVFSRGIEGLGFALPIGDALQKLNVIVQPPAHTHVNSCGNPL
jgi:S1-C subfamily serine protease